ncbi:P-loop containing nucleoside triphosphate hydrolase protein [Hygrophoropsis aurantiaca]|uniref:P-loop containing nucleoside triphosphate hydrolase protein n=1 Tax=Hygrophoropsis aurantiaca TaxID=72124 RepID=A0ACB8AJ82_9AGAM|nr:P-loop containing nucleoside triphosphate hydrolase protein [Hygrophoropsis aurantiaca]
MVSNTSGGESRNPTTQSEILPGEGRSPSKQQSNTKDKLPPKALRNIVIFGESGVGKSSLINACAGESVAQTSSGASGCTFEYSRYEITIGNETFGIWDTIGLDEGSYGRVPATQAEDNLKKLLHDLAKASGVDLLVYCVRGARMRKALQRNYTLFHSAICRKKVPIALVVTGLENHEGDMESWWKDNGHEFQKLNMHFCGHACVTTLNQAVVPSSLLRTRCEHSRDTIRRLIADSVHAKEWRAAERTWMDAVMADVRGMLGPGEEGEDRFPNLILCDITSDITNDAPPNRSRKDSTTKDRTINLQNPVVFHAKITNPVSFQSPVTFNLSKRDTSSMMPFDFHRSEIGGKTFNIFRIS